MVLIAPLVGAAVFLSGLTAALPTNSYDSSSNSYGSSNDNSNSNYGSSNDNSNYGSSNSNSYGGSSDSNSNYGNSNSYDSSSSNNNYESTSSSYDNSYDSTSSSYNNNYDSTSTSTYESTSTTSAYNSYQTSNYGSGSSYWGGSGYEDCVNQCIAQFGGGSTGGGSYQATATSGSYGSTGSGATHTVIVAPHTGVFRMVPFATNASVGDTIEFHWGANNHTVTKSSALLPCNKSSEAPVFASGEHDQDFVFTQVVNDTNPIYYYCGTATHCEKGMFGVINPAMAAPGSPSSLGGMMSSMAANDSDLSAYSAYSSNITSNNEAAANWGKNFDMSAIPDWAHSLFATNVLFTRGVIGMNADILKPDNSLDLQSVAANPLMLPVDISQPLNGASAPASAGDSSDAAATPAGAAETAPPASSSTAASTKSNGASSVASPRLLVAAAVVVATIFAL